MSLKIHQTPSSGSACLILGTKYHFGSQRCWASDPDGLCIHLLKSYFTVLKLTCSYVTNRDFSSFLLVGSLHLQQGLRWEGTPAIHPSLASSQGSRGLSGAAEAVLHVAAPFQVMLILFQFLMILNFSVPIFKKIKDLQIPTWKDVPHMLSQKSGLCINSVCSLISLQLLF